MVIFTLDLIASLFIEEKRPKSTNLEEKQQTRKFTWSGFGHGIFDALTILPLRRMFPGLSSSTK